MGIPKVRTNLVTFPTLDWKLDSLVFLSTHATYFSMFDHMEHT